MSKVKEFEVSSHWCHQSFHVGCDACRRENRIIKGVALVNGKSVSLEELLKKHNVQQKNY